MNSRLFLWALTSALAGFLFGFDTVVISGAEKTIQELWGLSDGEHGLAMSIALWGMVVGSLIGGWPTDKFGRKKTLVAIGILYFVSAVWSGIASDVYSFMIARFIGGLGVGISTVVAPLYISEISPAAMRGRLAGMFQFNIVFGILIAFLSNFLLGMAFDPDGWSIFQGEAWRWMLGIEAIPALVYTLLCFTLVESPRWLIGVQGNQLAGIEILKLTNADSSKEDLDSLANEIAMAAQEETGTADSFWTVKHRKPITLAFLVAFFNQLSGINAILYFAPRIFQLAGWGADASRLNSIGIGVTNLVFTFVGLYLIDRLGRRSLLFIGSLGYIASLGICSWAFFTYAPQFSVANAAITLTDAVQNVERVSILPDPMPEDIQSADRMLEEAKQSLVAASAASVYQGEAVSLNENMTAVQLTKRADVALSEASIQSGSGGTIVMLCIFAFIAAHAIGQGAVIWVFISEIFPNRHRASGQALGSFTHWVFAALLTLFFTTMLAASSPGIVFGFFCFMMVLQLLWVLAMVPETKGVPLEELEKRLGGAD